jgi:gamma-glutamyltranspeptidase/glutathione hydrolase
MGKKNLGTIASGNRQTSEAGIAMFDAGGNAFDAAIAAMLASFVVEPALTSAGGGGFLLARTRERRNIIFDFFCQTPLLKKSALELDFKPINVDFGEQVQEFHIGMGAIAVPGNIAGVFAVHKELGKLPFKIVAEPAINYARNGFILSNIQDKCLQLLAPIFMRSAESKSIYAPQDTCKMPNLANFLEELVREGKDAFYRGEIAHQIVKDTRELGGNLSLEDLARYRVIIRQPLQFNYRDRSILTNPPPSSGGSLIAFSLKLLNKFNLEKIKFRSREHLELLAQIMSFTNEVREKEYNRHIHLENISEKFLADRAIENYFQSKWGNTTHISVVDREGNAASVTTSNGEGSGYTVPNQGIMLNNMLGEADLNPQGFHNWAEDVRISSMMAPTIVLKDEQPELVLGSSGANRIRTAILQVLIGAIDFSQSLTTAVQNPRVHWEEDIFNIEPPLDEQTLANLKVPEHTKVLLWQKPSLFFGGVNAVKFGEIVEGVGDLRREGVALSC